VIVVLCDPVGMFGDEVVAAISNRGNEVNIVRSIPATTVAQTLYIMDISLASTLLPGTKGQRPAILAVTDRNDGQVLKEAVTLGAAGLLSINRPTSTLLTAIDRIASGQPYYDRRLLQAALGAGQPAPSTQATLRLKQLTGRERDVLAAIVAGHTTRTIAATLNISTATVRSHIQKVLAKLGVHSRLEAAAFVLAHNRGEASADIPTPREEAAGGPIAGVEQPETQ